MFTKNNSFSVKFWGVRGSYPVPGSGTVGYGGNTSCVEVNINGYTLIFDAGTGIIGLGRELAARARKTGQPIEATILFSHLHHDHTQGFPFFTPAYHPAARLHLYGPGATESALSDVLNHNQTPPNFPVTLNDMASGKDIRSLRETDVVLFGEAAGGMRVCKSSEAPADRDLVRVRIMKSYAHPGGVYLYRLEWQEHVLVYATDTEGYVGGDRRLVKFAEGADLLIHDAQYAQDHYRGLMAGLPSTQGYGHSTPEMACEVAAAAGVKQLILFHHDPNYDDEMLSGLGSRAREFFENTLAAFEGLEITIGEGQADGSEARALFHPSMTHPQGGRFGVNLNV
ncbi:MAG: MBL fold metallo-hydrolase [Chloroflexota bacterium]